MGALFHHQGASQAVNLVHQHAHELMHHKTCLRHDSGEAHQAILVVGNDLLKHFLVAREVHTPVRLTRGLVLFNVIESIQEGSLSFVKVLRAIIGLEFGSKLLEGLKVGLRGI